MLLRSETSKRANSCREHVQRNTGPRARQRTFAARQSGYSGFLAENTLGNHGANRRAFMLAVGPFARASTPPSVPGRVRRSLHSIAPPYGVRSDHRRAQFLSSGYTSCWVPRGGLPCRNCPRCGGSVDQHCNAARNAEGSWWRRERRWLIRSFFNIGAEPPSRCCFSLQQSWHSPCPVVSTLGRTGR